jgi:TM2 domain-containing membrane protein YozV
MAKQKSSMTAYLLAFFLGGLGIHLFYLGKYLRGTVYLLLCWTYIPIILGWFDMFFIKSWINGPDKQVDNKTSNNEVAKKNIVKKHTTEKFYTEEELILSKYAHIKTPAHIQNEINNYINPKKNTSKSNAYITFTYSTSNTNFIKDSIKFSTRTGPPCKFEPLHAYFTTFSHLNNNQLNWYFYWRRQVLQGNYVETDLSYIFLFVYELINYSFNQNAAFNISMLELIFNNYKEMHPKLHNYLPNWMADFLNELNETELAKSWENNNTYRNNSVYEKIKSEKSLEKVSFSVWKPFLKYPRHTEFFERNKSKIYNVFKLSTELYNEVLLDEGKDIFVTWFKLNKRSISKYPYSSAVLGRQRNESKEIIEEYLPNEYMSPILTSLFRTSENVTRLMLGEKRQIKVDENILPNGFKELLLERCSTKQTQKSKQERFTKVKNIENSGEALKIPPREDSEDTIGAETTINLDFDKIEKLRNESNELHYFFEQQSSDGTSLENTIDTINTQNDATPVAEVPNLVSSTFDTKYSEDYTTFVNELTELEACFLNSFKDGVWNVSEANKFIKMQGLFPSTFINDLNEKAIINLDDNIVEVIDDDYVIYDEFINVYKLLAGGLTN